MSIKTQKEKMLAGESYNCLDPELEAIRRKIKTLLRQFNLSETEQDRQAMLQQLLGQIGRHSIVEAPF